MGGYRWKLNGGDRLARHIRFARENGLAGVVKRAHAGKSFCQDPEAGPWASVIVRDLRFADEFQEQDLDRYLGLVAASARALFDRDMLPGAEPEELMAMKVPVRTIRASSCRSRSSGPSCRRSRRRSASATASSSSAARTSNTLTQS